MDATLNATIRIWSRNCLTQREQAAMARLSPQPIGEALMPDDKSKVGESDRSRVAADQDYEVSQSIEGSLWAAASAALLG
jgi:hypothetical protein